MHLNTVEIVVLALAAIVFVTYRQSRWQIVDLTKLFRTPIIFLVIGVISTAETVAKSGGIGHVGPLDAAIIGLELVAGVLAGFLMGRATEVRTVEGARSFRLRRAGLTVWLGFIAFRVGLGIAAHVLGATFAAQPMAIFFVLAVVKGVQALMVRTQVERHEAQGRQAYAETGF